MRVESRSKATIFRRLDCCPSSFAPGASSGLYRPTRRVAGVPSLGARSLHVVRSFGFCEAGVKKLVTALSRKGQKFTILAGRNRMGEHTRSAALKLPFEWRRGDWRIGPCLPLGAGGAWNSRHRG